MPTSLLSLGDLGLVQSHLGLDLRAPSACRRRHRPLFLQGVPGKYFHCNSLGMKQNLTLLTGCSPPCLFVILMNQEPSLAQAVGTSAQNIHELCCHLLMASLPLYGAIIPRHVTCSNMIFRSRPHSSAWTDTASCPEPGAWGWGLRGTMKGPNSTCTREHTHMH